MTSSGEYAYLPDGKVRLDLSDGSSILFSDTGEAATVLSQTTPDGDVFSDFDALGRPGHIKFADEFV